ncbi:isocitrate lyase/phosphoenolpyruvate mutase family protein [Pseudonocardia kunmingensis]|uniref:Phosphoenolpyruvate phosphomutase-like protein n=1 Tax=Pseudonocardia kunmingensis TaxID=630975 RepID=A0A543DQA4_9PSEU|nr:phosphoenolpyruvate phosphomutase-like protein [Pseudonocardia kunmingensis]
MTATGTELADRLRALHVPGTPLVLPNVWDAAGARAVVAAGFPAVATASAAIAPTLGYDDHESTPPDEVFAAVARIAAAVDVPVTADIERSYRLPVEEIAARLLARAADTATSLFVALFNLSIALGAVAGAFAVDTITTATALWAGAGLVLAAGGRRPPADEPHRTTPKGTDHVAHHYEPDRLARPDRARPQPGRRPKAPTSCSSQASTPPTPRAR